MILHFLAIASHIPTYDTNSQPLPNSLSPSLPALLLDWMLVSEYTGELTFVIEVTFFLLLQIVEQYEGVGSLLDGEFGGAHPAPWKARCEDVPLFWR